MRQGVIDVLTARASVAEAKRRLELAGARILGVALNRRTFPIPGFLYRRR
jgi:Mrp family chromosome partitioning ATPase